eukprot:1140502-Pelagomonas_calceolata.AAC.1
MPIQIVRKGSIVPGKKRTAVHTYESSMAADAKVYLNQYPLDPPFAFGVSKRLQEGLQAGVLLLELRRVEVLSAQWWRMKEWEPGCVGACLTI